MPSRLLKQYILRLLLSLSKGLSKGYILSLSKGLVWLIKFYHRIYINVWLRWRGYWPVPAVEYVRLMEQDTFPPKGDGLCGPLRSQGFPQLGKSDRSK
jgi:hypothetical protein